MTLGLLDLGCDILQSIFKYLSPEDVRNVCHSSGVLAVMADISNLSAVVDGVLSRNCDFTWQSLAFPLPTDVYDNIPCCTTIKAISKFCYKYLIPYEEVSFDLQDIPDLPIDLRNSPSLARYSNRCHYKFFSNDHRRAELRDRIETVLTVWGNRMGMFLFLDASFSRLATRPGVLSAGLEPGPLPEMVLPGIRDWLAKSVHCARDGYGWYFWCGGIKHGIREKGLGYGKFSVVSAELSEKDIWPPRAFIPLDAGKSTVFGETILKTSAFRPQCLWVDAGGDSRGWDQFYFFCIIPALVLAMRLGTALVITAFDYPQLRLEPPAFWNFMRREFDRRMTLDYANFPNCQGCGTRSSRLCDHCGNTSYCQTCFAALAAIELEQTRERALV
ncbi:hypothetical protein HDU86_001502 [Geranomyces michiganensis]|nr:hypothetical protein HDU86_001502 [Geranomyces michiganensis]